MNPGEAVFAEFSADPRTLPAGGARVAMDETVRQAAAEPATATDPATRPATATIPATGPATGPSFWERTRIGWHAAFFVVLGIVALAVLTDGGLRPAQRVGGLAVVAALAAWYALLGRRLLGTDAGWLGVAYLLGVLGGLAALVPLGEYAYLLMFVVFPQTWAILKLSMAVPTIVVVVVTLVVIQVLAGTPPGEAALVGGTNLVLSLVLGLWITGIVKESDKRADLIAQLQRTRAELAAAHLEKGALAERQRLSGEIHDTLAQGFMSILVLAQAAEAAMTDDPQAARQPLALIERTARENLAEARALVAALAPADLQETTLVQAIRRLADRLRDDAGVRVSLTVEGTPRQLPANTDIVLLRAAQEALTNIRRHAGATRVDVRLCFDPEGTELVVRDDGQGFDPSRIDGFGLQGMQARARQVGGTVEIHSAPGQGTTVRVRLS
jgi:signal transduction histidine kinase